MTSDPTARLGEVIEASTKEFTTQCYELYESPPLGALVRCGDGPSVLGVVANIQTTSMDPSRHPIARGRDETTEEGVYRSNPQLTRLLLTEFRSVTVGHGDGGVLRPYLPPQPPRIHAFVYRCGDEELRAFTGSLTDYSRDELRDMLCSVMRRGTLTTAKMSFRPQFTTTASAESPKTPATP